MIGKQQFNQLLPDDVSEDLLRKIISNEWRVGDKLPSEKELCNEYSVSRVSIRTALETLRAKNMIETRVGKGSYVISDYLKDYTMYNKLDLTETEYFHIVELRNALEFTSIDLMTRYADKEDYNRLYDALNQMKSSNGDAEKYVEADMKFHWAIIKGSHNPIFASIMDNYRSVFKRYLHEMAKSSDGNFGKAINNHEIIYEAIARQDSDMAKQIIRGTFQQNHKRLKNLFKEDSNENN